MRVGGGGGCGDGGSGDVCECGGAKLKRAEWRSRPIVEVADRLAR